MVLYSYTYKKYIFIYLTETILKNKLPHVKGIMTITYVTSMECQVRGINPSWRGDMSG